jgi:23S rRNA (pseudouridine1915-N3)-methyltransferase
MKIVVVAVGQKLPKWADDLCAEFLRRFGADWRVELKAVKAETRGALTAVVMQREAERIRAALPKGAVMVALDERGKALTTLKFHEQLAGFAREAQEVAFIIGGADGLDAQLKAECALHVRLSDMTLPHALARVLLLEQIYRAYSIAHGHPYHRE